MKYEYSFHYEDQEVAVNVSHCASCFIAEAQRRFKSWCNALVKDLCKMPSCHGSLFPVLFDTLNCPLARVACLPADTNGSCHSKAQQYKQPLSAQLLVKTAGTVNLGVPLRVVQGRRINGFCLLRLPLFPFNSLHSLEASCASLWGF